jgi:hypothetical protein
MGQPTLAIVILFSLTKSEGVSTFGASNFKIWHRYLPGKDILRFICVSFAQSLLHEGVAVQQIFDKIWSAVASEARHRFGLFGVPASEGS